MNRTKVAGSVPPNPAGDGIDLAAGGTVEEIRLIKPLGSCVLHMEPQNSQAQHFGTSALSSGVYMVHERIAGMWTPAQLMVVR